MVKRVLLFVLLATLAVPLALAESPTETAEISIPAGTLVHCRTNATITTMLNKEGDAFTFNVTEPVMINGRVAIPVGSAITGRITQIARPGRISGVGQMRLNVQQIYLPDSRSFPFSATLMTAYGPNRMKVVGNEGLVKGPSSRRPDAEEIGAGTVGGTLIGLMCGHPIVGATVGLTAATVDRLRRRGKELTIPVGTQLNYQLTRELAINHEAPRTTALNQIPVSRQ
jgi:hypothetical protein